MASAQGNDDGKGKLPLINEENQNVVKKFDGDASKSVKALVRATMELCSKFLSLFYSEFLLKSLLFMLVIL